MNIDLLANHLRFEKIFNNNKNEDGTYNWLKISKIKDLPNSFIDQYFFQIYSYGNLEKSGKLSKFIIKKYGNYLNWTSLLMYQNVDETLIDQFQDKINFKICVMFQNLSLDFLIKYKDKFKLSNLEKNTIIKKEIVEQFKFYLVSLDR